VSTDETFGERLKRLRKVRGLSATRLGAAAGIEANAIFKLEGGTSKEPGFFVGTRLAEILGVPARELAFGDQSRPDLELRLDGIELAMEITPKTPVEAKRKRGLVEAIAAAMMRVDGAIEVINAHTSPVSQVVEPFPLEELRATVTELADALAEVQTRLSCLEEESFSRNKNASTKRRA
jgi:transcriptional regulator with XRE-family HTH domain